MRPDLICKPSGLPVTIQNSSGKVWPSAPQRELKKKTTPNQKTSLISHFTFVVLWSFDHGETNQASANSMPGGIKSRIDKGITQQT
jgi:hypothetical protein